MNKSPQRKAEMKYRKKLPQQIVVFYPGDMDAFEHLSKQPNKQGYIKDLIRADIKKKPD